MKAFSYQFEVLREGLPLEHLYARPVTVTSAPRSSPAMPFSLVVENTESLSNHEKESEHQTANLGVKQGGSR
jgi:hypothetical protein